MFLDDNIDPLYNLDNYTKELKYRLKIAHAVASRLIDFRKLKNKQQYDKNLNPISLKIGDNVIVTNDSGHKHLYRAI